MANQRVPRIPGLAVKLLWQDFASWDLSRSVQCWPVSPQHIIDHGLL